MEIWRINTEKQSFNREAVPEDWQRLGGRGLIARILLDEVPATCDPLGPLNKLIICPGLLAGHNLSSLDRISMGGKSPLTGGVKESNAGGITAEKMTRLGIKAVILEGFPQGKDFQIIHLSAAGVRFEPAGDLVGKGVYESARVLRQRFGDQAAIALIGPAGEMQMLAAGVTHIDKDGVPSRYCGRGGLGALMGCKKVKAVIVDSAGSSRPPAANPDALKQAHQVFTKAVLDHPQSTVYREYGTAAMVRMCNSFGALPTLGFSAGSFEFAEDISGETMREKLLERPKPAATQHACMPGCIIQCSNVFTDEQGNVLVSPLEYETIGLMGSNLGMKSLEEICRLNWESNDIGLDTIDTGAALGVAAQAGLLPPGDCPRALELLAEVRKGSPLGRILGNGAAMTGKVLGVRRVPVVKGQAMAAYDPRAVKGTGVTYATSPQGADHTCGLTIRAKVDHTKPEGQAALSRASQINMAGYDTLGACLFTGFGLSTTLKTIGDLLYGIHGWEAGETALQDLGKNTLNLEREFNRRAGFTSVDDRIPEWMMQEPLPPTLCVFDVPAEELDNLFNFNG
jgi:aldehyde:ferredoxin oxidoreductase